MTAQRFTVFLKIIIGLAVLGAAAAFGYMVGVMFDLGKDTTDKAVNGLLLVFLVSLIGLGAWAVGDAVLEAFENPSPLEAYQPHVKEG